MIIPPEQLSEETLRGVIESYITREGTDYGSEELSLADKVSKLLPQVLSGKVLVLYDEFLETITLKNREEVEKELS